MGTGAERAAAPQPELAVEAEAPITNDHIGEAYALGEQWTADDERRGVGLLPGALLVAGLLWTAAVAWAAWTGGPATSERIAIAIAAACGPLLLLGLAWLIFGQTRRRETERFREAVRRMSEESVALESVLAIIAGRLEDNHTRLTDEAAKLMSLGDEASDRLGRVTHYLARETAGLDRRAAALEAAAANARVDIGVLLHDLPRAEAQAGAVAEALKQTGLEAHSQAGALEGQLSALIARGREADEVAGGAAQRLGAHLARIDTSAAAAAERIEQSSMAMKLVVDESMSRAADGMESARAALDAQSAALLGAVEQSRAALTSAGDEAAQALGRRLETLTGRVAGLADQIAAQHAAGRALASEIASGIGDIEERFAALGQSGATGAQMMTGAFESVRTCAEHLFTELQQGHEQAGVLIDRAHAMAEALGRVTDTLDGDLKNALTRVEEQASRAQGAAEAIAPAVTGAADATGAITERLAAAEAAATSHEAAAAAAVARLGESLAAVEAQLTQIGAAAGEADTAAARLTGGTAPALVEALLRVRDAAGVAAERARDAITAVIPESAAKLAEASSAALEEALAGPMAERMAQVGAVAADATEAARRASERLTRQLVTIGESAAAVERRIAEARREREAEEADRLPGRVSLLIESLHSAAIDVTKILSNEVTDAAWAAYLKGDRGVFTRRAVRLLDTTEAREVLRHYEEEPEFRDQVNRYVADFENLLRRVLADPDGSALGVTLLSSDMGKLYVALAQAIERLR